MPLLWRHLLSGYLRIFFLSIGSFISLLLVARFKEIARFAALSDDGGTTLAFVLYQIPLILPIAIPFSALIASFLFIQQLSQSNEITAFRSAGVSFPSLLAPLLLAAFFFSLTNFAFTAEIFPACKRSSKTLFYEKTSSNPLLLLQRQNLVKVKRSFLQMDAEGDAKIRNILFMTPNRSTNRLMLLSAQELAIDGASLEGKGLSLISFFPSETGFDSLFIENQKNMTTHAEALSHLLKKRRPTFDLASLSISSLLTKGKELAHYKTRTKIELYRRLALSWTPFTFTFLGAAFGIEIGRTQSRKNLFSLSFLALLVLMGYFFGKELKTHCLIAAAVLFFPQLLAILASCQRLQRIEKGTR